MATDKVQSHCILYEFQQGRNATEACRNLLKVFGEGTRFLIGHVEDGMKNLKQMISTFLISHVLGDHL